MRHMRKVIPFMLLMMLVLPVARFQFNAEAGELKVGFIYPAPVGDAGWSSAHDSGRKSIAEMPGVTTTFIESVPESSFSETVLRNLVQQGCGLIFAASYGYMDSVMKVAREFPNTVFMHCSGYKAEGNVGAYFGRIHEAMYLAGMTAGAMTRTNQIGFVGAYPMAEVIRNINAFTLGVRSVNPAASVQVMWTHTWFDPPKEKQIALSLLDSGADVIAQHQDSPACQIAAQERGKFSIGYNTDMSAFAPDAHLTSAVWNWSLLHRHIVKQVQEGAWKSESLWWGLDKGVVDLAPFGSMIPMVVQDLVLARKALMVKGEFQVFTGPVEDQEGVVRIPSGRAPSDAELYDMTWLVKGVLGKVE